MVFLSRKNHLFRKIVLNLAIITGFFVLSFYVFAQTPGSPLTNPGSQFQVCTVDVSQPACYDGDSPEPTLNWTFATTGEYPCPPHTPDCGGGPSSQEAYWVQIDDSGNHEGDYSSPEVNTEEVSSSDTEYTVPLGQLQFNTTYYWKVAVKDNFETWSGWTCADSAFTTAGHCNRPPTAINLQVVKDDYCSIPVHYFSWTYSDPDGDDESQFQFQVDDNNGFSSPEIDRTQTGSWPDGATTTQAVIVAELPSSDQIVYDTTYYWRVKVYDDQSAESDWIEGSSFKTEKHRYPFIDFSWSPQEPSAEEDVAFADQSTVYGGATKSSWSWTFEDGDPATSGEENPVIQFTSRGVKQVSLGVTDSDGFTCQTTKSVGVQISLPGWREILPW